MATLSGDGVDAEFLAATLPHMDAVWGMALRLAADRPAAEDLVQETYLRAFRSFADQGTGSVRSWLAAICLNTARSQWRTAERRPREELGVDMADVVAGDDVAVVALARAERSVVASALAELSDDHRVAVVLVDIGGLTSREAAEVLNVPRGTILARVHRGRRCLAGILTEQGLDHGR